MTLLLYAFLFIFPFVSGNSTNCADSVLEKCTPDIFNLMKSNTIKKSDKEKKSKLEWWQTSVIYEIYVRSFKDSNGDGVGDLQGIIEKIPYLKELGIGAIWLTSIFSSAGYTYGYDITDYRNIDIEMGSMNDFDELKSKLHENGIKIILDFVPNHTSHVHEWFHKSVRKEHPYTDYYVWADAKYVDGIRKEPNNWTCASGESMWEWNDERQQYYLHQFYKIQPDLNFWNESVRDEIKNALRFWLDKGVDGFRFDSVQYLYEKKDLEDGFINPFGRHEAGGLTLNLPESFKEVEAWRIVLDEYNSKDDEKKNQKILYTEPRLMAIESYLTLEGEKKLYGNAQFPLSLTLSFLLENKSVQRYMDTLQKFRDELPPNAWPSWTIGNHDIGRPTSHFDDELLDGIVMIQLLLPGTPVVYFGDELGMTKTDLRVDELVDITSITTSGSCFVRESHRTPFQWDSTAQAGFSSQVFTWLPVNPDYVSVNVESQKKDKRSHLKIFKKLVKLRQKEVFQSRDVTFYEISEYVFAFLRSGNYESSYFVVINFGSELENINLKKVKKNISLVMTVKVASVSANQNVGDVINSKSFTLRPKAAVVLEASYWTVL